MLRSRRELARHEARRRRWFAGGLASVLVAALALGGISAAVAATTDPSQAPAVASATPTPDVSAPATEPAPDGTIPDAAAAATDAATAAPEASEPGEPTEQSADASQEPAAPVAESDDADQGDASASARLAAPPVEDAVPAEPVTLRIKKLSQRASDGTVGTLAGASFYAVAGARAAQPSIDATSPYTCTTDATGYCDIAVPALTGGSGATLHGYWIIEGTAPAGWSRLTQVATGQHTDPKTASPYMFFTGPVSDGVVEVTAETAAYADAAANRFTLKTKQDGVADVRSNPAFPESCGLSIALVFDTSRSIDHIKMAQMKAAAADFVGVDGLGGTASSVALYGFGTTAYKLLDSTSLQSEAGQDTVAQVIDEGLGTSGSGFTNWDDAFREVAFNAENERYDLVLFLSDGDPTTYGTDGASNVDTNVGFRNVEEGVFSANALKDQVGPAGDRTKVAAIGIGATPNSYLNLIAVSGPVEDEDYYLTDFPGLASKLHEIATRNCGGTLTVIKQTVDEEGVVIDESADGWSFTGSTEGDWIVGPDGMTNELTLETGALTEGSVNFPLDFTGTAQPRAVTVAEVQQEGWTAESVTCVNATVEGDAESFTVDVPANGIVSCTVVNKSSGGGGGGDVGIEKEAVIGDVPVTAPLEAGESFDYLLTVTNHGSSIATDVAVTDPVPARLQVTGITLPEGWTNDYAPAFVGEGNGVALSTPTMAPGESVEIRISVVVAPAAVPPVTLIGEDDPAPTPPALPESTLLNEACVSATVDTNPDNDCAEATVTTKDISAVVYTRCVNDAPLLGWTIVKSASLVGQPVEFLWVPNNSDVTPETTPAQVAITQPGGTTSWSDEIDWPGTAFTPSGISIDYPGWRAIVAADIVPGSTPTAYYLPGTDVVMTPEEQSEYVFNGLILDPSELDFAWRGNTDITFTVNPELTFSASYPAATETCSAARHSDVQIEKTASVEKTAPGKSFTYTLAVENVSDDAAAESVVVTDAIPADLKITNVTWPGKGDAAVFPNWDSCAVTGQNSSGYGGTLECVLFGPLQPAGSDNGGASAAPTITLAATVYSASTASVLTNVAVVDYHTFGDPTDPGRDSDDATVLLSALPATGGEPAPLLAILGLLALLAGASTLVVIRRRRAESKPTLL
ncbi:VWA domain-containing protein [Microbacterium allomyrinae]|uniref:DUF11 domain-containing protein n=1 Tax=Microbacterium allomyrinae TaxID=2830666 RepID=A0A9X1S4J6_9MICO|nr:VWA domain-containing protein [Microbacterium allomyrinae]MCC2033582.1 DUF11 domain-containing protein [Microbacterium allomyrinae]